MAVFNKQGLITELLDRTELVKAGTQPFLRLTGEQLNFKPAPDRWSIAEVFGHLNVIHDLYIRVMLAHITRAPEVDQQEYRSGWIGDFLYEKIKPRTDGTIFRMRSPRVLHARSSEIDGRETLQTFLSQCDALDDILRHVYTKDIQRIRIPLATFKLVKLRLGDHLRFIVAHNERHLLQAHRVLQVVPQPI